MGKRRAVGAAVSLTERNVREKVTVANGGVAEDLTAAAVDGAELSHAEAFCGPIAKRAVDHTVLLRIGADQVAFLVDALIPRFQCLLHLPRIRHERAVGLTDSQNRLRPVVSGERLLLFTVAEKIIAEPEPFSAERLHEACLFEPGNLLVFHELHPGTAVNPGILTDNDKGHNLLVFAFLGGVCNAGKQRVVLVAGEPPPAAHQHVCKRVLLRPAFGKLLDLAEHLPIHLFKSAFIVFDLP